MLQSNVLRQICSIFYLSKRGMATFVWVNTLSTFCLAKIIRVDYGIKKNVIAMKIACVHVVATQSLPFPFGAGTGDDFTVRIGLTSLVAHPNPWRFSLGLPV
jgi:hypothetical protein